MTIAVDLGRKATKQTNYIGKCISTVRPKSHQNDCQLHAYNLKTHPYYFELYPYDLDIHPYDLESRPYDMEFHH